MLIKIRPIEKDKWHGKKGKDSFAAPVSLEVLYDRTTGKYATGLTEEEVEKYEKIMGVSLSDVFNATEAHSYWSTNAAKIKLANNTVIFNSEIPAEYVKWKNCKASRYVANSLSEYNKGFWPDATHYIQDEEEETAIKASKFQKTQKAHKLSAELSLGQKASIVRIIVDKPVNKNKQDFVDVQLAEIFDNNKSLDKFIQLAQMDKKELTLRAQILDCLYRNILTKEGTSIYYMGDKIALDYEDAIRYFADPQNQQLKVAILEKLDS